MARAKRLYWDSCAWLGLLNGEQHRLRALEAIFTNARDGHYEIWTSTYTLVEVNRYSHENGQRKPLDDSNLEKLRAFFLQPFIKLIPVDEQIATSARKLIRETPGLSKRPDAVHLASAIKWSLEDIHTYDGSDLLHLSGLINNKSGHPIKICVPDEESDGPLFAHTAR
jgi:predicted nucleic acid-binding protein